MKRWRICSGSRCNIGPMVWLVTASGEPAILEDAQKVGFAEVLLKPLSVAVLHDTLQRHLDELAGASACEVEVGVEVGAGGEVNSPAAVEQRLREEFPGTRLLLVEDDLVSQEVAMIVLEELGWQIDCAGDGQEAVDKVAAQEYQMILMDMQMPVLNGVEATRIIRQLPGRQNVPIVAMTANAFSEDRAACLSAGMNDFISKPVDPAKLFGTLLQCLKPRHG